MIGVTTHWEVAAPRSDHAQCQTQVEEVRAYHKRNGYSDIAYNWLVCVHGGLFEGRGWGRPSGANGTTYSNLNYWAVCLMTGPGYEHGESMHAAWASIVGEALFARSAAPKESVPHSHWIATQCPGDIGRAWVIEGTGAATAPAPPPPPEEEIHMGKLVTFQLGGHQGQIHTINVNDAGGLVHTFAGTGGGQSSEIIGKGAVPNGDLSLEKDYAVPGRLDVFAEAADGKLVHAWFQGGGWANEPWG